MKGNETMNNPIITILGVWNVVGFLIMTILTANLSRPCYLENILSPVWIYNEWKLNYFGVALLCIFFNLLCPIWTIGVWTVKLLKFICTVGRR